MGNDLWQLMLTLALVGVCILSIAQRNTLATQEKEIALRGAEIRELKAHLEVYRQDRLDTRQKLKSAKMLLANRQALCKR